jgi:hypothetical protein
MNASTGAESKGRVPTAAQAQASTAAGGALQSVIFFSFHSSIHERMHLFTDTDRGTDTHSFFHKQTPDHIRRHAYSCTFELGCCSLH